MKLNKTNINDLFIITELKHFDKRGYFNRFYDIELFKKNKINFKPSYCAISFNNKKGVIRGLHFQKKPFTETKLIKCLKGAIFDVVIDLRKNSKTYKKKFILKLNADNNITLLIPKGCAHGYQTLVEKTKILYVTKGIYNKKYEAGIRWNDPFFKIKWPLKPSQINSRDKNFLDFKP